MCIIVVHYCGVMFRKKMKGKNGATFGPLGGVVRCREVNMEEYQMERVVGVLYDSVRCW